MTDLKFDLNRYLEELEVLVNIDSGSNYPEGVKKVADFFKKKYLEIDWLIKEHKFDDSVGPCLEIKNCEVDEYDILFIGHMDTVFPAGTVDKRPFSVQNSRAYGPGVIDMKSGLLSLYYVINFLDIDKYKNPSFCIALNSDEEISSKFSSEWIESLAKKSKYAFVLEPARKNGALVLERKGLAKYEVEFHGIAAHAGVEPEKGASAITELGHWIVELNKLNNIEIGTTVNVGVVSGGTKANVVADKALAEIDFRFKSKEEGEKIKVKMDELKNNPIVSKVNIIMNRTGYRPPMNPSKETIKLCGIIEEVGEKLGIDIKWASTGGGSDANFTSAAGTSSIDGLGPIGGNSHSESEYLEKNSIEPRIQLLKKIIEKLI
ncbi:M20 family metallopeptidase [Maledivibacter halophilus]|uniref:Glutamate carboxypeptidase n=1 Tax=Maledivibacter halophilus TaxID=36842 RepID=A0A1T5ITE8_9FIRM|nr:M20 family metallopeptidase [Maledivibacter halophilus]SKC42382.1 glutamate carboxypeptidase [Maledivibacter halophilus]